MTRHALINFPLDILFIYSNDCDRCPGSQSTEIYHFLMVFSWGRAFLKVVRKNE